MNPFQDLAQMTRDYGLVRYFVFTSVVVSVLMLLLFAWGHVPDGAPQAPANAQPPAAPPAVTAPAAPSRH